MQPTSRAAMSGGGWAVTGRKASGLVRAGAPLDARLHGRRFPLVLALTARGPQAPNYRLKNQRRVRRSACDANPPTLRPVKRAAAGAAVIATRHLRVTGDAGPTAPGEAFDIPCAKDRYPKSRDPISGIRAWQAPAQPARPDVMRTRSIQLFWQNVTATLTGRVSSPVRGVPLVPSDIGTPVAPLPFGVGN
jgi:hypothetical protein